MFTRAAFAALIGSILVAACSDGVGPRAGGDRLSAPRFSTTSGPGIALDQQSGTLAESGVHIGKGFELGNPRLGDAIVATFLWVGTSNTITEVTDHLSDGTPVNNHYKLVDYVTTGGISMATYVATNVQNYPYPNDPSTPEGSTHVLDVHAIFAQPVTGGILISAYSGVNADSVAAIGAHRAASGSGSTPTVADPGSIPVSAGSVAYAVTMSDAIVGTDKPAGFTNINNMSDNVMDVDGEYMVSGTAGSVDPQWTWYFTSPGNWLASVVALNPASMRLSFVQQPSRTLPFMTISPAVRVAVTDDLGNTITGYNGPVTIAIGHNGGLLLPGTLSGTKTVTAVNGIATFADLSIDHLGNGYTLTVSGAGLTGAQSAPFNVSVL